jgi:CDP-paratose 2-epimerase
MEQCELFMFPTAYKMMKRILITGGAGFIGSNLSIALKAEGHAVVCFDNLSRRGSELLLQRIQEHGGSFIHGDVRNQEDFSKLKDHFDILIECSAEPSVLVGTQGEDARFQINNNLFGTVNCLEFARIRCIPVIFLSTSRVYPYTAINKLIFIEGDTRFEYADHQSGVSSRGISTDFSLHGRRSLYGATKLASEYLLQEYSSLYNLPSIIDRCGVIAGPWQLGKVDQGVFTYWLYRHFFEKDLCYIGFGGSGKQVRDLLHIDDLVQLINKQITEVGQFRGEAFNVGGSDHSNLSLNETTALCRKITGKKVVVSSILENRPADVKWFITDNGNTESTFNWKPKKKPVDILSDIYTWLCAHAGNFSGLFIGE